MEGVRRKEAWRRRKSRRRPLSLDHFLRSTARLLLTVSAGLGSDDALHRVIVYPD
jgi:hypothetical protein